MEGKYVVIEGHDGTGKSTQVGLVREKLESLGIESIEFHEPAGSPIADEIRTVLKNGTLERDATTDLLLFSAARRDIWFSRGLPALEIGKWIVAARNYYSTLAYQGYGSGLDLDTINEVTKIATSDRYMNPDISVVLDLEKAEERAKRIGKRGLLEVPDTYESRDDEFQNKVREGYLEIAKNKALPIVGASRSVEAVAGDIWKYIEPLTIN